MPKIRITEIQVNVKKKEAQGNDRVLHVGKWAVSTATIASEMDCVKLPHLQQATSDMV